MALALFLVSGISSALLNPASSIYAAQAIVQFIGDFRPHGPARPDRADVRFLRVRAFAAAWWSPERGIAEADVPIATAALRNAFCLPAGAVLDAELSPPAAGFVDVLFMDGDVRIVRGNNGNDYCLRKIADVGPPRAGGAAAATEKGRERVPSGG